MKKRKKPLQTQRTSLGLRIIPPVLSRTHVAPLLLTGLNNETKPIIRGFSVADNRWRNLGRTDRKPLLKYTRLGS